MAAYALGLVGKTGEVHAFEPVPKCFAKLLNIKQNNPSYHLYANEAALGEKEGVATISVCNQKNIGWNSLVPEFLPVDAIGEKIEVSVTKLDNYLFDNNIEEIRAIKIDAEGYEFPILKGMRQYLSKSNQRPILIVEITPLAYSLLNVSLQELSDLLSGFGYIAFSTGFRRKIDITSIRTNTDVMFIQKHISGRDRD